MQIAILFSPAAPTPAIDLLMALRPSGVKFAPHPDKTEVGIPCGAIYEDMEPSFLLTNRNDDTPGYREVRSAAHLHACNTRLHAILKMDPAEFSPEGFCNQLLDLCTDRHITAIVICGGFPVQDLTGDAAKVFGASIGSSAEGMVGKIFYTNTAPISGVTTLRNLLAVKRTF